jgi:hypothetical protein
MNTTLSNIIESMDNAARIPALRSIVHSSMAKCIGAIRQHIRDQARIVRNEEGPENDLDQRNGYDENVRSVDDIAEALGFDTQVPPLKQASLWHAVYDWAQSDLRTLATSKWDAPLTVEQMIEFMINKTQALDKALAQALAEVAKTDVKTIERMHELQAQREREQFIEAKPEIVMIFNGFGDNGFEDSVEDLPNLDQYQLSIKLIESLNKARDQVLARVLRTRRIADLASVPLIEDASTQVRGWAAQFEKRYGDEIRAAIDLGRNIRTLDDMIQ